MSESWHDYGFGICTSNLKEEISLPGLMELISQAPELKERVNTFMNNECGGFFNFPNQTLQQSLIIAMILNQTKN